MCRTVAVIALFLLVSPPSEADTTVRVGARVVPFLVSSVVFDTGTIEVDEKRRTVTVTATVTVRTNDPEGYLVIFEPLAKMVRSAEIEGFSAPLRAGAAPAFAVETLTTTKRTIRQVRIRLDLRNDVKPGRYALPFILSIRQLTH